MELKMDKTIGLLLTHGIQLGVMVVHSKLLKEIQESIPNVTQDLHEKIIN